MVLNFDDNKHNLIVVAMKPSHRCRPKPIVVAMKPSKSRSESRHEAFQILQIIDKFGRRWLWEEG